MYNYLVNNINNIYNVTSILAVRARVSLEFEAFGCGIPLHCTIPRAASWHPVKTVGRDSLKNI